MTIARFVFSRNLALVACLLLLTISAFAQFRAAVQGTIFDSAGAVVANAKVSLLSKETGRTEQTTASTEGFYRFSSLAPGEYTITVESANFKKSVIENVRVAAETLEGVNVTLETGGISESVVVNAETNTAALETEDGNIRKTVGTEELLRLPQPGRDPYELARLAPGVFGAGARGANGNSSSFPNTSGPGGSNNSIFATENVQPISANGQRVSSNNYQIDGTSVNSQTWGGGAVITPSQESVKEVQVTSSTYSAEDGRNSGAQIKVVSQNGTNQWHGSAFYKRNDPSLNAFNKFPSSIGTIQTVGPQRVERKYDAYGGSFGGRVIRDRLFFFFAYEGLKENTSSTFRTLVETSGFRQRIITARPNTLTAAVLSSAGVAPRVNQLQTATCDGIFSGCAVVGDGMDIGSLSGTYGNYVPTLSTLPNGGGLDGIADVQWALLDRFSSFKGNQYNTRIDFLATNRDKLTFTSYFVPNTASTSSDSSQSRPQADINSDRLTYALGFIYNRNISATTVNEARFNITRWGYDETKSNPDANLALPRIEIEGFYGDRLRFGFPSGLNTPGVIDEKQLDFRNVLTTIRGNHVLKFGGEYRRDLNSNGEIGGARPLYSFHRPWNFANGTPIFEFVAATLQGKPAANNTKFTTSELGFFVQDDWKVRPTLTLNLGLRWSYLSPVTASNGVIGNLQLGPTNGLQGAKIVTNKQLHERDLNNFGPQFGFAYNPNSFGKHLVIRGGAGLGFDRLANALLANARRNPPNGALFGICCGTAATEFGTPFVGGQITFVGSADGTILGYPANPNLGGGANPTTGLPNVGGAEIYGAPQDLETPYVIRYSLEAQYELPANLVATLSYQGSGGRHFVRILPLHIMTQTNPNISAAYFASSDVNSSYNAMIARLQGRLFRQFSFDTNYRFSKSLDTSSFEAPCACTNQSFPVDQREERGRSDFDVRHSFVASGTWDLPFFRGTRIADKILGGWQISGIATSHTGFPWTPKLFGCLNGNVSGSAGFCDPRPTALAVNSRGINPGANTNDNFLRPGGLFGVAGTSIFSTAFNTSDPFLNRPAIGRNTLNGPKYFSLDMTFGKRFGLPSAGFLGENANVDVKFNFFNILNTLNLAPFNSNSDPTRIQLNTFGVATSALSGRVGEFQIRFSF
ncbi:MAG: TonB-dependent receptor [Pyrinomonadaceae bacterium]